MCYNISRMPAQASALLSTKLNRPPVPGDWVDRPRLIEQLNRSLQQGPLTLVCASAGFGKTTLVSSWIDRLTAIERPSTPAVWLSLDESDSDLVVFLRYFVAAIRTVFPDSCAETLALLRSPNPTAPAPLVVVLANELERLPARIILVLDDYHVIRDQAVHDFLCELMRHWPQRLHLVLISRSSPPWPLARLRAKGQLAEIRTRDLRFTLDEAAAFLDKVLAAPLSPAAMALLDQRLEGWIAGLRLVTLSLGARTNAEGDLADLSGTHFEIADYLVDEVMASLTPAILRFLLSTSILDRFCAALCECILGGDTGSVASPLDVQACIRWLENNNLFVIPLDNQRQWYRYHHLLQELLQRRLLAEVGPARVTELHRSAAAWFGEQGLIDEALRHALAINDLDLAAHLMFAGLCEVLNREDRASLDRWLRLLPDGFIPRHPLLLTIKAVVSSLSWQLTATWKLLDQIEALLDEGNERAAGSIGVQDLPVLRGIAATLRGQQAFSNGQPDRAIAYGEEALALLPNQWRYVRGVAVLYWGLGMQATGRGDAARRGLIEEYASLLEQTDAYALRLLFTAGFSAIEAGHLEQARLWAQVMLDHAAGSRLQHIVGFALNLIGVVHYYWNDLDAAGQRFEELVAKRFAVHSQAARNGMIGMAWVHVARGDISAAWSVMELLSQFDLDRLGQDGDDARSLRAQLALLQGDTETAYRWADAYAAPVVGRSLLWLQDPHLAKARIILARGTGADVQLALDMLDVLYGIAVRTFGIRIQTEIQALRALALEMQGKTADAFAALQQAVECAWPGGFIRVFVDLGPPMQSMLLGLAQRGFAAENVQSILAAFPEPQMKTATAGAESAIQAANARLVEPLTDRELEVLALLRQRLSHKEIARMLGLSPSTVKRYTVNLYGKLGVGKRSDAVIKAETLGIVPPH